MAEADICACHVEGWITWQIKATPGTSFLNFNINHVSSKAYPIIIIIIIIISIFKEDNVFSIIASLPYGPPMNTDIDYYRT